MFNVFKMRLLTAASISLTVFFTAVLSFSNMTPASAFVGTLENGNMAYAQGSGFDKGEACNYLPGITADVYDAWHFVLTTRGAVFQQDPANPAIAINLNFVFMRQDGSTFVLKSGAWVQTGKGAYVYTLKADKIRMVQTGSVAKINVVDSGMRLSHTCPGTGSATTATTSPTPTPTASISSSASPSPTTTRSSSPTPTATASSSPSPTATRSTSPSPTATRSSTPTPTPTTSPTTTRSPSPTPSSSISTAVSTSPSPSMTASPTRSATPSARPSVRASAIQPHSTRSPNPSGTPFPRNPIPTPTTSIQPIGNSPTPSPSNSRTSTPTPTRPTQSPSPTSTPSPTPTQSSNTPYVPPVVPTPPPVEDPKNVVYVPPTTPVVITPTEPPASPIVITKEPEYGTVKVNENGTLTYTPEPKVDNKPVVDLVVFQYTNLSGATVVVRKEFIVTQRGDVPKIIQTGNTGDSGMNFFSFLVITLILTLTVFGLRGKRNHA